MYYRLEIFVLLISNSHTQFPCQLILLSNLVSVLYVFKYLIHCYNPFTLLFNKIIICRISSTETINDTKGLPKKADNMESVLTVKLSYLTSHPSIVPVFDEKLQPIRWICLGLASYSLAYPLSLICWMAASAEPSSLNSKI